ncbi:uncharacterized protein J3R85_019093 [Psidium guajava]|nr:uncharacterized protein J3R85_019093 [Psidium guajava]
MPDELFLPNLAVPSKSSNHLIEVDKVMTPLPLEIMRIFDLVYSSATLVSLTLGNGVRRDNFPQNTFNQSLGMRSPLSES